MAKWLQIDSRAIDKWRNFKPIDESLWTQYKLFPHIYANEMEKYMMLSTVILIRDIKNMGITLSP